MGFQGFARQETVSDNQIRIDIASVIDSDLAEARRQANFADRNAALDKEHRTLYGNKLIEKHEVEKRNREENFADYMKYREEIQKIVQYNNEVKFKDAGKDRHVKGLDSILGEGLLKLAVAAGSAAITKAVGDWKAEQDEAEQTAKETTLAQAEYIGAVASPEQLKIRQESDFIEILRNGTAEQIKALNERYAAAGDHRLGVKSGEWAYKISQLDEVDRHLNLHSPANVSSAFQGSITNYRAEINGANLGLNDVLSGTYDRSTYNAWMDQHRADFMLERGLNGIHPQAKIKAYNAIRKLEQQLTHNVDNNEYKRNLKDREIRWVNHWEHGSENIHQRLTDSFDPNGSGMAAEGVSNEDIWAWKLKHAQNGGMSTGQITKVMSFQPPGLPSINDQGPSKKNPSGTQKYREWRAALDGQIAREEQGYVNTQREYDGKLKMIADQI